MNKAPAVGRSLFTTQISRPRSHNFGEGVNWDEGLIFKKLIGLNLHSFLKPSPTATNPSYAYFLYYLQQVFPPLANIIQTHGLQSLVSVVAPLFFDALRQIPGVSGLVYSPWQWNDLSHPTSGGGQVFSVDPAYWYRDVNSEHGGFPTGLIAPAIGELTNSILQALGLSTSTNWESFLAQELSGIHPEDLDDDITKLLKPPSRKRKRGGAIGWIPTLNNFFEAFTGDKKRNKGQGRRGERPATKTLANIARNLKKQVTTDLGLSPKKKKTAKGRTPSKTNSKEGCCCINIYCKGPDSKVHSC